jgi:membrane-associated protein
MSVHLDAFQNQLTGLLGQIGPIVFYLVVWGLVFVGTALLVGLVIPFITGDTLLFTSGIIAASGLGINIWTLAIGIAVAAFAGDQVGYAAGRRLGRPLLDKRGGRRTQAMVARADRFYSLFGWWSMVVGRFIPWARIFIPIFAGAAKMRWARFATANLVGTLLRRIHSGGQRAVLHRRGGVHRRVDRVRFPSLVDRSPRASRRRRTGRRFAVT